MTVTRVRGPRRSKLIATGDNWELLVKANASAADIVHLELEDGIAEQNRDNARRVTARALAELDWSQKEAWVRIRHLSENGVEDDIAAIVPHQPHLIYVGKAQSADDMLRLDEVVGRHEAKHNIASGSIQIGCVIERIHGLHNVEAIAAATPRMGMIVFGVVDMANEFGYRQSLLPGADYETLYVRSRMVMAARLAGIDVIDAPYMMFRQTEDSETDARFSARLGFTGKSALTPRQLDGIHRAFSPTEKQLGWARQVLDATKGVEPKGSGLAVVDGDFVEVSHIAKAKQILARQMSEPGTH